MSFGETLKSETEILTHPDQFVRRHIGPNAAETAAMLKVVGYDSVEALTDAAVPKAIRLDKPLELLPKSEFDALRELKTIASQNQIFRSFIGMGYYDCITPPVIQRNVLENPGWYAIHAVSGRDFPRTPRSAAEFPDDGRRPHRARHRQRLHARRSHCRR